MAHHLGARPRLRARTPHPTVIASSLPAGRRSISRPMRSSVSNLPASSRSGSRTTMSPPMPAAWRQPLGADRGKARAAVPLREARHHGARQRAEDSSSGVTAAPSRRQARRRIGRGLADDARSSPRSRPRPARSPAIALGLDQDAGELRAVEQQIVRPFELERGTQRRRSLCRPHRARASADHEAELRQMRRRRRIGQQQAGVEIARLRGPDIAAPAAPGGLARRRDPQRPALPGARARQRLRVGRAERLVGDKPNALRRPLQDEGASEQ